MEQITMSRPAAALPLPAVRYCHECGQPMREVQRMSQGDVRFAWFECTRRGCEGVFLQRQCSMSAVPYDAEPSSAVFA